MTEPEKFNEKEDLLSEDGNFNSSAALREEGDLSGSAPSSEKPSDPVSVSGSDETSSEKPEENDGKRAGNEKPKTKPVFDVRKEIHGGSSGSVLNSGENPAMNPVRILLVLFLAGVLAWWFMNKTNPSAPISYGFFLEQLEADNLEKVVVNANRVSGEFRTEPFAPEPEKEDAKEKKSPSASGAKKETAPAFLPEKKAEGASSAASPETSGIETGSTEPLPSPVEEPVFAADPTLAEKQNAAGTAVETPASEGLTAMDPAGEKEVSGVSSPKVSDTAGTLSSGTDAPSAADASSEQNTGEEREARNANEANGEGSGPQKAKNSERKRLPKRFTTMLPSLLEAGGDLDRKIRERVGKKYEVKESPRFAEYVMLAISLLVLFMMVSFWMHFRKTREELGGGQMFGFGKSPAKRFQGGEDSVTFADVAGLKSVKEDISEIVDFLKNPKKFEKLGARIPKGVLMCGPPGTGKTLLARAIAGEAGVPFYSINASEFIQLFVGVGASRVRDMFEVARNNAPSILFIDEIDSVGRERGAGTGGGNDEREQTLNQILSEMDGFSTSDVVIVIAATNRPDVLDPALLRPGRFDRHVTVDRPVQKDRIQLFQVHTKKVPLNKDVDFERLAAMTTGLTGADIRNIVNEAALWACRFDRENVSMNDFYYAVDKILMGAKREEVISAEDKEKTSYHEAGHALVGWLIPECDRVRKVSVIPRGRALGVTWSMPDEDRMMYSQDEILAKLKMMLGGREAEKLVFNELNAGAANDLERATGLAHKMVAAWGMSSRLGPAAFKTGDEHPFLGRELARLRNFSEKTAQIIDEEIMRILNETSLQVQNLLTENRNLLDALAQALVIREELDERQIEEILGPPAQRRRMDAEETVSSADGESAVNAEAAENTETAGTQTETRTDLRTGADTEEPGV